MKKKVVFEGSAIAIITPFTEDLKKIDFDTFLNCTSLKSVYIPSSVTEINRGAFGVCTSLSDIFFDGSMLKWKLIDGLYGVLGNKKDDWCYGSNNFVVHCTDGDIGQ